jgi:hypothetical protein
MSIENLKTYGMLSSLVARTLARALVVQGALLALLVIPLLLIPFPLHPLDAYLHLPRQATRLPWLNPALDHPIP